MTLKIEYSTTDNNIITDVDTIKAKNDDTFIINISDKLRLFRLASVLQKQGNDVSIMEDNKNLVVTFKKGTNLGIHYFVR